MIIFSTWKQLRNIPKYLKWLDIGDMIRNGYFSVIQSLLPTPHLLIICDFNSRVDKTNKHLYFLINRLPRRHENFKFYRQGQNSFYNECVNSILHPTEYVLQLLPFEAQLKSHFFQVSFSSYIL